MKKLVVFTVYTSTHCCDVANAQSHLQWQLHTLVNTLLMVCNTHYVLRTLRLKMSEYGTNLIPGVSSIDRVQQNHHQLDVREEGFHSKSGIKAINNYCHQKLEH